MKTEPTLASDETSSLSALLSEIVFSEHDPATVHNENWRIHVAPRLADDGAHFDALVTLTPFLGKPLLPAGCRFSAPPCAGAAGPQPLASTVTDSRGQAWFRDLPYGEHGLKFEGMGGEPASSSRQTDSPRAAMVTVTLAAKSSEPIRPCQTGDGRFAAMLSNDGTKVIIATEDQALRTALVSFQIGGERHEVQLRDGAGEVPLQGALPEDFDGWLDDFMVQP